MQLSEKQSPVVFEALKELDRRKDKLNSLCKEMLNVDTSKVYSVDMLAIGSIDRSVHTSAGVKLMVESFNMLCARSLIRFQLDTALRFSAIFLVSNSITFAIKVLNGEQINNIEDSAGKKLTDTYLATKIGPEYPWVPDQYKNLCNYVHFSNQHVFNTIQKIGNGGIMSEIHERDLNHPEANWIEVINHFNMSTDILIKLLEKWIGIKKKLRGGQ